MTNVVVVGGESGIGLATVLEMKNKRYEVWATAKDKEGRNTLLKHISEDRIILLDLSKHEDIHRALLELNKIDSIDVLICNAGVAMGGPVSHLNLTELRYVFEVNVFGHLALIQDILPKLEDSSDARIIWIGSAAGYFVRPLLGGYASSKFAVSALTDALRVELMGRVMVSLIAPGRIKTPIWEKGEQSAEELMKKEGLESYTTAIMKLREEAKENRSASPDAGLVVRSILHAMTSSRPRPVYRIGMDAKLAFWLKWFVPTRWIDALLRWLCW